MSNDNNMGNNGGQQPGNRQLFGKYKGTVIESIDPEMRGRILAEVPAVQAGVLNWALPCSPYAGPGVGWYAPPPPGAHVWIEFEGGDPTNPIWTGCFWEEGEIPAEALANPFGVTIVSHNRVLLVAGDDISATASGWVRLKAGVDVNATAEGAVTLDAGTELSITTSGDITLSSATVAISGLTEVAGDLLVDGQQVI